jgi:hypothetical protein
MLLYTHELITTLQQGLKAQRDVFVTAIRPHLYVAGGPAGTLQIVIRDAADTVTIASSNNVTITSINTVDFFHGYIKFDINAALKQGNEYIIRLQSSGYSLVDIFSDGVGWCNDWDLRKYQPEDSLLPFPEASAPFDLEVWEYINVSKGSAL